MLQVIEIIVDGKEYQIEWNISEHFDELKERKFMLNEMAETAKLLLSAVAGAVIQYLIDIKINIDSIFENGYFTIK